MSRKSTKYINANDEIKHKCQSIEQLSKGIEVLRTRLNNEKQYLLQYIQDNPKFTKFSQPMEQFIIKHNIKVVNDNISQKLITQGLKQMFKELNIATNDSDANKLSKQGLTYILKQRQQKQVSCIEVCANKTSKHNYVNDPEQDINTTK